MPATRPSARYTIYRYKRPPQKRKPAALGVQAIVTPESKPNLPAQADTSRASAPPANDDRKSAIVTARKPRGDRSFADVPDMTPEEHQRRGDAADALWRELVRRATGKA